MVRLTRRKVVQSLFAGGTATLSGCSSAVSEFSKRTAQFRLDDIYVESVNTGPVEFGVNVLDGEEVVFETTVELDGSEDQTVDWYVIEESWMEEEGRYGFQILPNDGEPITHTLEDALEPFADASVTDHTYVEYSVLNQGGRFRYSVNFYDEPRRYGDPPG